AASALARRVASRSSSRSCECRARRIKPRTSAGPWSTCSSSSRRGYVRRPNNGCGAIGAGAERRRSESDTKDVRGGSLGRLERSRPNRARRAWTRSWRCRNCTPALAYWHDVACKVLVKHECRVEKLPAFDTTIHRAMLGDIGIIEVDSLGLNFAAVTKRNIANEADDVFLLGLQLGGSATLIQDGREATLQPGDFALLDAQRPYVSHYSARWRRLFLRIPRRALKARLAPSSQLTARAIRHTSGIGGLVSEYMRMIPQRVLAIPAAARAQIGEQILDLAAIALAAEGNKDRPALSSARSVALLQLRTAVE